MAFKIGSTLVRLLAMLSIATVLLPQQAVAQEAGEVTTVTVTANAYDNRTDDSGCTPDGCIPENTLDGNLTANSRWSCSAELVEAAGEECQIIYAFAEAQGVASVSVAFYNGDERTRTLAINVNGELLEVVESGGLTSGLETFELGGGAGAPGVLTLGLESQGLEADDFLSIIEVELQVSDSVTISPSGTPSTPVPAATTATPVAAIAVNGTVVPTTAPSSIEGEAGEVTTVTVTANAYDNRTDDSGCTPDGCIPENTRDGNLTANSRWSCSAELVEAAGEECQIIYAFDEAQGVASVSVAFFKGDERTRTLAINVNGELFEVIESGGLTSGLETFELGGGAGVAGVLTLGLESQGLEADDFLSIIEVEFQVSDSVTSPPAGTPSTPVPAATAAPSAAVIPVNEAGEMTNITVTANAYDNRTDDSGCTPDGCIPENTRDGNLTDNSRWSCSAELVEAAGEECQIIYAFDEAQGVASVAVAFYKGDNRTRTLAINVNGELFEVVESGGLTSGLETFALGGGAGVAGVLTLGLEAQGLEAEDFLSIIEVEIQVSDSVSGTVAPAAAPTPALDPTSAPGVTTSARDLDVTSSPITANEDSYLTCYSDDVCMECIEVSDDRQVEYDACMDEAVLDDFCDAIFAPFCCGAAVSGNDCTSIEPFVDYMGCVVESADACSIDDMTCPGVSGWGFTPSPSTDTSAAGTGVPSEGVTSSGVIATSDSTSNPWLACSNSTECLRCVDAQDEYEAEFDGCMEEAVLGDVCDAIYASYCCNAALVGDDCASVDTYVDFVESLIPSTESCSFDDTTCVGITADLDTAGNSSGPPDATAAGWWRRISFTFALGLVVAVSLTR